MNNSLDHCCDCGSSSTSSACCDSSVTCSCGTIGDPNCTCECIDENFRVTRPLYQKSIINIKAERDSLYNIANYFNQLFPNQIAIPVHLLRTYVRFNFINITVEEAIDRLGLIRLRSQLIPYTHCWPHL
ncbi:hypothetical protein BCI9360_01430 [Bacillus sp. CECT 9360]|nr:hypothetical protein BCI9360_01430 [Bacillus sp. CECT 9360]